MSKDMDDWLKSILEEVKKEVLKQTEGMEDD